MKVHLKSFLCERSVRRGEPYTHTSKGTGELEDGWPSKSYFIDIRDTESFWTKYCNSVSKGELCTLTEKQGPFAPLLVDLDFKTEDTAGLKRQYTVDTLKALVKIYQEEIKAIVSNAVYDNSILRCIVLEKPAPRRENGEIKDGFHLHFPFFICRGWIQDRYLRDRVTARMVEEGVWAKAKLKTNPSDIIDTNIRSKCWHLYGSVNYKSSKSSPYLYNSWKELSKKERFGHAFDHRCREITMTKFFREDMKGRKNSVKYYLPRFLSVISTRYSTCTPLTPDMMKKQVAFDNGGNLNKKRRTRKVQKTRKTSDILEDIKMIKDGELMDMLSQERADNYYMWMDVGWTLFNVGQGMDEALQLWIEFSQRSAKFEDGVCEREWGCMELKGKTIASLLFMAKNDSPDEYAAWKNDSISNLVEEALYSIKPNDNDVAAIFNKLYGENYICVNSKKGIWYEFADHRWREMDACIPVRTIFRTKIRDLFLDKRRVLRNAIGDAEDILSSTEKGSDEHRKAQANLSIYSSSKKACDSMIFSLGTKKFHDNVLGMLMTYIHKSDFLKVANMNTKLICFENGMLDLENCMFREGRPDDFCTLTTGYPYETYRDDDAEMEELDDYLGKVYVNKNLREYFIDFMAACLEGGNRHKRFLIAVGQSDGAKSMTLNLLELTFGSGDLGYFGRFPRELIAQATGKVSSAQARPELVRAGPRRLMATQELGKERPNIGFLKEITGNDPTYARTLHKEGTEIKPQYTLVVACNVAPDMPPDEEAMWSRTRLLPHESKFVKPQDIYKNPVPESKKEQYRKKKFKADPNIHILLPEMKGALMYKLFVRYQRQKRTGDSPIEPPEVMYATEKHKTNNDIFKRFISECITKVTDVEKAKESSLKMSDVESEFKTWYAYTYPSFRYKTGRNDLKREITKNLGKIRMSKKSSKKTEKDNLWGFGKQSRWWGYTFTEDEDDGVELGV